jgi:3-oxoacyl-[acyl-carrier-protein] synthase II
VRPVVSGLGAVSPLGAGAGSLWAALLEGRDGIRPIASFNASAHRVGIGAEVPAATPLVDAGIEVGRAARLAATAGAEALAQAGLEQRSDVALCIGTTMGEAGWIEGWPRGWADGPLAPREAGELRRTGPDRIGTDVAALLGLGGGVSMLAGACAAGNMAIAHAADLVRLGRAERVLAGGTDAFSRVAFTGFARLGALAGDGCRPFSADRQGLVLGEGAAMLVVEAAGSAAARGAPVLAELQGCGLTCDAHHVVAPHPEGDGLARAAREALHDAGAAPADVDWICAHGTGTPANDAAEVSAARSVFGAGGPPMSSIKALTGHGLGAASALEAVACVLALAEGVIPPTWRHRAADPACDWDVVPNAPRKAPLRTVLNNAAAFGGVNASIVLART